MRPRPMMKAVLPVITFDNVCYAYPGVRSADPKPVLYQVDKGEFVSVIGENGRGAKPPCPS